MTLAITVAMSLAMTLAITVTVAMSLAMTVTIAIAITITLISHITFVWRQKRKSSTTGSRELPLLPSTLCYRK